MAIIFKVKSHVLKMREIFSNTVFVTQAPQYLQYSHNNSDTILALKL